MCACSVRVCAFVRQVHCLDHEKVGEAHVEPSLPVLCLYTGTLQVEAAIGAAKMCHFNVGAVVQVCVCSACGGGVSG